MSAINRPFHGAWLTALADTLDTGGTVSPRGMKVKERLGVSVRFDTDRALLHHPRRGLNYRFAIAEWVWMAHGSNRLEFLTRYNKQMAKFSDDGETLTGAYGPRLFDQWSYIIRTLNKDRDSRQAVSVIWTKNPPASHDIPCTLTAQFLIRQNQLVSIWNMRSSDLWLGLPYDAYTFSRLAACVAGQLGVDTGEMVINAGSSHLYEEHFDRARDCVYAWKEATSPLLPAHPGFAPFGLSSPEVYEPEEEPWKMYAEALRSKTSAEAFAILTE